jgi:hypothetical protein
MDRYATVQEFGGQRASIHRLVLVVANGQVEPGLIVAIGANDQPIIRSFGLFPGSKADATWGVSEPLAFRACPREQYLREELAEAGEPFWTWPPRV